jgi:hypothetical protein
MAWSATFFLDPPTPTPTKTNKKQNALLGRRICFVVISIGASCFVHLIYLSAQNKKQRSLNLPRVMCATLVHAQWRTSFKVAPIDLPYVAKEGA